MKGITLLYIDRLNMASYPDAIAIVCIPLILAVLTIAFSAGADL